MILLMPMPNMRQISGVFAMMRVLTCSYYRTTCSSYLHWYNTNYVSDETTSNQTYIHKLAAACSDYINAFNGVGAYGNIFIRNYVLGNDVGVMITGKRAAYRAGVPSDRRVGLSVSNLALANPCIAENFLLISLPAYSHSISRALKLWPLLIYCSQCQLHLTSLTSTSVSMFIPGNSLMLVSWKLSGVSCTAPDFSVNAIYTNALLATL